MYPSAQKAYAGIFVKNQYEELCKQRKDGEEISISYLKRSFTSKVGSFYKYAIFFLKFIPKFWKRYDVVHLHYFFPMIVLVWTYKIVHRKSKLIVTFHGSDINLQVNEKNERLMRYFAQKIDVTIPVGKEVAKNVREKLGLPIDAILPVGIDNTVFYPMQGHPKIYDIIFVGSFFEVKGIDILYETIRALPKTINFCIVGKGALYQSKFEQLKSDGYCVTVLIDQPHEALRRLYNSARFLFQPSRSEGFPTVTLEAMYCGIPVITSDIPQFKEQVNEGVNGLTFPLKQKVMAVTTLQNALNMDDDAYKKMSSNALKSFKDLSLSAVCAKLWTIYRS